jgi:hypothetical protein
MPGASHPGASQKSEVFQCSEGSPRKAWSKNRRARALLHQAETSPDSEHAKSRLRPGTRWWIHRHRRRHIPWQQEGQWLRTIRFD